MLESLLSEAARYAEFCLRKSGQIPPTMMAQTEEGLLMFLPDKMGDTKAKDDFVTKIRLITASYAASAVVLVLESWMTTAKKGEKLDMTPPSESHDRQEMVVLIGEGGGEHRPRFLPIVRLDNGKFWNLGEPQEMQADSFKGRFTELLPPKLPDPSIRETGKALLKAMGVELNLDRKSTRLNSSHRT